MTTIYPTLIEKIETIINSVESIKEVFTYPVSKLTKYPCAIIIPSDFENNFETNSDNMKTYGFKVWIVIATKQIKMSQGWGTIMPKVMDEVLEKLDSGWDFSTINGHRTWCKVNTGAWTVNESQDGVEVQAEVNLQVKVLTSNS